MPKGLTLRLADGQRWLIRPVDEEAAAAVARLAAVMQLPQGESGRELYVAVDEDAEWAGVEARDSAVCRLPPADRPEQRSGQLKLVADAVARDALARGGLLLHAALAEHQGSGFIMAGPGSVGKSTASRRLPSPWRSLCDDATLVVRDAQGRYWAHPWPTWSDLRFAGSGEGTWPVERAVPLRAVFFLSQSPADRVTPIGATQAAALVLESAVDFSRETYLQPGRQAARELCAEAVDAARAISRAVQCHTLELSIDGRFWENIERVLPGKDEDAGIEPTVAERPASFVPQPADRVVYTGMSMFPTLVEPELLEIVPCGADTARPGDVICFRPPGSETTVVHRVRTVEPGGVRTRGDNCPQDDAWFLPWNRVIGRVRSAQHGAEVRQVPGGNRGLSAARRARLGRSLRRAAGLIPGALYRLAMEIGPLDWLLPRSKRPRFVRFDVRGRVSLKLLMGRRVVGRYDYRRKAWQIRWPLRLFVDRKCLGRVPAATFHGEAAR